MTFGLGYLMGLIVGEGCFTQGPRLTVQLHVLDPEPLRALQMRFGGALYGPYVKRRPNGLETAMWHWQLGGEALWRALPVFNQYLPQSRKRIQYERWKGIYRNWMAYHAKRQARWALAARRLNPEPTFRAPRRTGVPPRHVQEVRRLARKSRKDRGRIRHAI